MARQSLVRKYLLILLSILVITFLSVFLIQRTFEQKPEDTLVSGGVEVDEHRVTLAVQDAPYTLDPVRQDSTLERLVCDLLYQCLFEDEGGIVVASDLIELIEEEKGALQINLNPAKLFHVGRRVGAEDVKYSIERTIRKSVKKSLGWETMLAELEGLDDFLEGKTEDISGIQIVDGNSLRIEWSGDMANLERILSFPQFAILEKMTLMQINNYGSSFSNRLEPSINGTGPYRVVGWDDQFLALAPVVAADGLEMERIEIRFEDQTDSILYGFRLREYDAGLFEGKIGAEEDYFPSESLGWSTIPSGKVLYLKIGILSSEEMENALTLALNRSNLRKALGWERVLESLPELSLGLIQPEMYYENPEIARTSWLEVKEEQGKLVVGFLDTSDMNDVAQALGEDYTTLDIPVQMLGFETNRQMEEALLSGEVQAYLSTYYADAGLYQNGAYMHYVAEDAASGMRYVPLLQDEQYYRIVELDDVSPMLMDLLGK
jgi:hypothetical protein